MKTAQKPLASQTSRYHFDLNFEFALRRFFAFDAATLFWSKHGSSTARVLTRKGMHWYCMMSQRSGCRFVLGPSLICQAPGVGRWGSPALKQPGRSRKGHRLQRACDQCSSVTKRRRLDPSPSHTEIKRLQCPCGRFGFLTSIRHPQTQAVRRLFERPQTRHGTDLYGPAVLGIYRCGRFCTNLADRPMTPLSR